MSFRCAPNFEFGESLANKARLSTAEIEPPRLQLTKVFDTRVTRMHKENQLLSRLNR